MALLGWPVKAANERAAQRAANDRESHDVRKIERSIDELYAQDPERADAAVFGRKTGVDRRGFLGGAGLAADGRGGRRRHSVRRQHAGRADSRRRWRRARRAAPAAPKGPQYLKFPGKDDKLVLLGDRPLVAETPEHLLDDDTTPTDKFFVRNNGQIPDEAKEPDKWKITIDGEVNNKLELTLGELKSKFKPVTQRMVLECGGNGRSFFTPHGARQSVDQWRRRLRGMDRRAARPTCSRPRA